METLGIDVSASPARTAACRIAWSDGQACVFTPVRSIDDQVLAEMLSGGIPCGIDVPLGWPTRFVEALIVHRSRGTWPDASMPELVHRATDRWVVAQTAGPYRVHPLSVSTEKLGRTALRVAKVMSTLSTTWPPGYRAGVIGGVVEVYPAAALSRWASRRYRYKGRVGGVAELTALAAEVLGLPWLTFESQACREAYATDGDNFDALIASLVARTHAKGLCEPIPRELENEAAVEGWIALPRLGTLDLLPGEALGGL